MSIGRMIGLAGALVGFVMILWSGYDLLVWGGTGTGTTLGTSGFLLFLLCSGSIYMQRDEHKTNK